MRRLFVFLLPGLLLLTVAYAILRAATSATPLPEIPPTPNVVLGAPTLTPTAAPGPTAVPTAAVTHIVSSGDTLLGIALSYDVPLAAVLAANGLEDPDVLAVGQELQIPGIVQQSLLAPDSIAGVVPSKPPAVAVNGLPESQIVYLSAAARSQAGETFRRGQELGRNPRAFSTAGDSTTEIPFFLARFDAGQGSYNLAEYAWLQPVIDQFQGSFARDSVSVRVGLHSWTLFDPTWADKTVCQPGEGPLPCEIRLHNPAVLLVRLGSNDYGAPGLFDQSIREAVDYALAQGVIPVIGLKADRGEGSDQNNELLRQIAADYSLPLWDFDAVASTVPGRGLGDDQVHMTTFYSHDYSDPTAFSRGHALHNLTALMMLDTIWKEVILTAS